MPAIYRDVCCLNRPFDDQTQNRIHLEAEAVIIILTKLQDRHWQWISSQVVDFDLLRESVRAKFANKEKLIPINMKALEEGKKAASGD